MRAALVCLWLLIPAGVAAYHYGPGQEQLQLDDAAACLARAERHAAKQEWSDAAEYYEAALTKLPATKSESIRRVRLERAKAQMLSGQLPQAFDDLTALSDELSADKQAPKVLVDETRDAMANAQYYLTWLMRLEGRPREEWEPVIDAGRQNYRLLAEQAAAGDHASDADKQSVRKHQEDLESAIRLARMDLADLQALPLPSQCKNCNSGNCKCACKKPGNKPKEGEKDARGASSGPPPDNRGS